MGGRGTFAKGNKVSPIYRTVDYIHGVPVLEGTGHQHSLPAESDSHCKYIKLNPDGSFRELRIYDEDHYLVKEIAYHREPDLDPSYKPILHIHEYKRDNFNDRYPRLLTEDEYNQYKKYFKGTLRWKMEM